MGVTEKEYKDILLNQTSELVASPKGKKLIGNKRVFIVKLKLDKSLKRYKSRLVAKDYDQIEGLDYNETFSPIVKQVTIRVVLTLTCN